MCELSRQAWFQQSAENLVRKFWGTIASDDYFGSTQLELSAVAGDRHPLRRVTVVSPSYPPLSSMP